MPAFAVLLLLTCATLHNLQKRKLSLIAFIICLNLLQLFLSILIAITICKEFPSNIMSLKLIFRHNSTACQAAKASVTTSLATAFFVEVFFSLFLIGGKKKPKGAFR